MGQWSQKIKLRIPALILLGVTIVFWSLYERYEPAGPVLLESPTLEEAAKVRGNVAEEDGVFILEVSGDAGDNGDRTTPSSRLDGKPARIDFPLSPEIMEHDWIRISGMIKLDGVVVGKHSWNCARLLVIQYDADNKWIPGHHFLIAEKGTRDWAEYEDVFVIQPEAVRFAVVLQQGRQGRHGTV